VRTAAQPPNPITLFDSAFDLLRAAPSSVWLVWAAGSLPFGLGVIAFVGEMTGSARAAALLPAHAFLLALLFLWMMASHALFARRLWPLLAGGGTPTRWGLVAQAAIGSTALLMWPLAALSVIGFPWTATFYYSASAAPEADIRGIVRYASRQASTWSFSSVLDVAVAFLLGLIAFVNVLTLLIAGPIVYRTITGEETVFTTNTNGMMNSTLFAAAAVITWLLMDPLLHAACVIRCFRVDAIRTGVDLRATIARAAKVAVLLALFIVPMRAGSLSLEPHRLDRSIHEVTSRPEFLWQEPRPLENAPASNAFIRFTQDAIRFIGDTIHRVLDWVGAAIRAIVRWLMGQRDDVPSGGLGPRDVAWAAPALYVLMALTAGVAIALLLRLRIQRRRKAVTSDATTVVETVDLANEEISPDQAPEDTWLAMAARLVEAGDLRLATRALYLAILASLGERGLIAIHRAKSNLDYQRELSRRARGNARLLAAFQDSMAVFERTWYGEHTMSREAFDRFQSGALEMRAFEQA